MTIGDMIDGVCRALGGVSKDEQDLARLEEGLLSLKNLRAGERKKKEALAQLIRDKQAELAVTTLRQNQISLAKEILKLKGGLDQLQKTEDEVSTKVDAVEALIAEKHREINAKKARDIGISADVVEDAMDRRKMRTEDDADLSKALQGLESAGRSSVASEEDVESLLAAAMSNDTARGQSRQAKADSADQATIAAAAASASTPTAAPASAEFKPGVTVAN